MDQRCVICKSATYDEHDALVSSLRKQFWQMVPIRLLIWGDWNTAETNREDNIRLLGCTRVQGDVMKTIIFHENTIAHSPSNRYIVQFLRKYVEKIESMEEYELDDEMIEFYISLSATTNMSPMDAGVCFKTYTLDKEQYMRIVLQEEQLTISHGTTGLLTWEAGLFLSDFFVEHPDIIRDKNVIELGSGCGLAGFTCAAMGAANVLCTDVNGNVLHILEDNRKLNPSIVDKIQVADLDWEDTNECARLSKDVDVVIGSDIVCMRYLKTNMTLVQIQQW
ncbi:hypothetical protein IW140_002272 [Coemansia sp. RSA 1813]|nr:hypothetical protein IW140_002272 [Coemansia sp. RSA 1813]